MPLDLTDEWLVDIDSGNGLVYSAQQAITAANVDPDLCCHMLSLGHSELNEMLQSDLEYDFFIILFLESMLVKGALGVPLCIRESACTLLIQLQTANNAQPWMWDVSPYCNYSRKLYYS